VHGLSTVKTREGPTPPFSATLPIYAAALSSGHDDDATASTCAVLEAMAGLDRGRRKPRQGKK